MRPGENRKITHRKLLMVRHAIPNEPTTWRCDS
jgi:hypothetical protein